MAGAVQFYGKDQVMDAVEKIECPAWAIFHSGNRLFTKFEEDDLNVSTATLEQALDMLMMNPNDAIYILKFFRIPKGQNSIEINEKSVCNHSSFNFKTITPAAREQNQIGYFNQAASLTYEKRIMKLEQELKEAQAQEEPESIGSVLLDLLKQPNELAQIVNIGRVALGLPVQNYGNSIGATRIGGQNDTPAIPANKEEQLERLANAVDTLEKHDPDLVGHLEKLAKMAVENPKDFKARIGLLDIL